MSNQTREELDSIVNQTLERVRKKLLDLSRRNNLINFRETRRTIRIIDELPDETFRLLVNEGKSMQLLPFDPPDEVECSTLDDETLKQGELPLEMELGADPAVHSGDATNSEGESGTASEENDFQLPEPTEDPEDRHIDLCLQTPLLDKPLERRSKNILRSWRSGIDETGMNFLYLAMGFLDWYEDDHSDVLNRAPLILVPVHIERARLNRRTNCYTYVISYSEEDIESNLSLAEMLDNKFDLILPELTEDTTPENYFEQVRVTTEKQRRWSLAREMILGFFSFAKIRIYRDLHDDVWPGKSKITKHPIVRDVLIGSENGEGSSGLTYGEEYEIDRDPYAEDIPLILDADSSQHSAILDAVINNKNLVIEGPPGTGKSQTITNLIAVALHENKSVLFVSEKKAALEVVRNRLDATDLGDFCLELHSHKTQKGKLHVDLAKRLNQQYPDDLRLDHELKEFGKERDRLRTHYALLSSAPGGTKETIYEILWGVERWCGEIKDNPVLFYVDNALDLTRSQISDMTVALKDLVRLLSDLPEEIFGIWEKFKPKKVLLPDDAQEVLRQLSRIRESTEGYSKYIQSVREKCGDKIDSTIAAFRELTKVNTSTLTGKPEKWDSNLALSFLQDEVIKTLEFLTAAIEKYANLASVADKVFEDHRGWEREDLTTIDQSTRQLEISGFGDSTPEQLENLATIASSTKKALDEFTIAAKPIHNFFPEKPEKLGEFARVTKIRETLQKAPLDISLHAHPEHALEIVLPLQKRAHEQHQELTRAITEQSEYFVLPHVPEVEEIRRLSHIVRTYTSWVKRLFSSEYRNAKKAIRGFLKAPKSFKKPDLHERLDRLAEIQYRTSAYAQDEDYKSVFGALFKGVETNWQRLGRMIAWSQELANTLRTENGARQILSDFPTNKERFELVADKLKLLWAPLKIGLAQLNIDAGGNENLADILAKIEDRESVAGTALQDLSSYPQLRQTTIKSSREAAQASLAAKSVRNQIESDNRFSTHFGEACKGVDTDTGMLQQMAQWITKLKEEGQLDPALTEWVLSRDTDSRLAFVIDLVDQSNTYFEKLDEFANELSQTASFDFNEWLGVQVDSADFSDLLNKLDGAIGTSNYLVAWSDYCLLREKVIGFGLRPMVEGIEDKSVPMDEALAQLQHILYRGMAKEIISLHPELAGFKRAIYDNIRERLVELDQKIRKLSRKRVANRISQRSVPPGIGRGLVRDYTELALIKHELTKKRRHIPIRQLVRRAGEALQALKPCFMMGPLSVAQYLIPGNVYFDLVVMDEASQLKLEDVLGAIARCSQAVVVGDPKQLPPTTFFERMNEIGVDDDDVAAAEEAEAILDVCQNCFDNRRLRWHYRSEHESLIAFSNKEFYDNDLIVFPSPYGQNEDYGVNHHFVKEAKYRRGKNKAEAEAVANAIMDHFKRFPELSLGVATFNIQQRDLIQDEIERLQKQDYWLEERIKKTEETEEPFFIKNLENVQGDERDVVFISTTYGPDSETGQVYQRFGPINRDTGWRRLNVIVTRAKKRLHLFTSMRSTDVNLTDNVSRGVVALKRYLEYAESGRIPDYGTVTGREPQSDFQIAVANLLNQHGHKTTYEVGVTGFFIDIGIHHPDREGEYILGVECDGATYHAAKSIRDRDLIRQKILENKGWKIWRIWSTDWFRNRDRELNNLLDHLNQLIESERVKMRRAEPEVEPAGLAEPAEVYGVPADQIEPEVVDEDRIPEEEIISEDDEIRSLLLEYRRKKIEPNCEDVNGTLLADDILEAFVIEKPTTKEEFQHRIPLVLRLGVTEPDQVRDYLDEILEILEEFVY